MHLDTVCTMVDVDAVVMYPAVADTLTAHVVDADGRRSACGSTAPEPFLVAAAKAMRIDTLRVIDTGLDPVTAEREQWDDGNNTLALAPRLCRRLRAQRRDQRRLEDAGIEVRAHPRQRARQRPGRPALHVVPGRARDTSPEPSLNRIAVDVLPV